MHGVVPPRRGMVPLAQTGLRAGDRGNLAAEARTLYCGRGCRARTFTGGGSVARRLALVGGVLGLSLAVTASALAQQSWKAGGGGMQIGAVGGVNLFTWGGSDVSGAGVKSRTAFYAGLALNVPLGSMFFVQPEVLYAQKGAKDTYTDATLGDINETAKEAYVDVPILLGVNFGRAGGTRPRIYAGPSVGVNVSCEYEQTQVSTGNSASVTCPSGSIKTLDLGVTGGGGIEIPFGRATFTLDGRYTLGLTSIFDGSNVKNQGFSVGAGIMFRFGGK